MAKKKTETQNDSSNNKELIEVTIKTNDEFVVFPNRLVYFVDRKAKVTQEEREQLKGMGVL